MQAVRERLRREEIPRWYRWWLHVGLMVATSVGLVVLCVAHIHRPHGSQWMAFFGGLLLFNAVEYFSHRFPFHHRMLKGISYRLHTGIHHAFFVPGAMSIERPDDLGVVMLPPWAMPASVVALTPALVGIARWASPNAAWLFLLAIVSYHAIYESLHTASHLPEQNWFARHPFVRAATLHHRMHHDPTVMQRYNFNFGIPLFDWLLGTHLPSGERPAAGALGAGSPQR
jgi:hypothetical protein